MPVAGSAGSSMMFSEDRDYVERSLAGETEAFESLVRKCNRMAGAIAFGILGDFHEAEDVVQEAFFKAFRSLRDLRDAASFRAWFAGLVRSKALDAVRKRTSFRTLDVSGDVAGDSVRGSAFRGSSGVVEGDPEDDHLREESRKKTLEAIAALPAEDRLVIALKHMEGLSYKEIAEISGSTVSAVESRLFRARQMLRKKLESNKTS